jgi:L-ascorbate metabolism protein UlaG (beta-lactamase superfamily)
MSNNSYYHGPVSGHFDGKRFFNPGQASTDRSLAEVWRWKVGERRAPWPANVPVEQVIPLGHVDGLRITMIGHATLLIQIAGVNILTDPVWSDRASPVAFAGPRRVNRPAVDFQALPRIDAILLSHNHYDHLDVTTLRRLHQEHQPVMISPLGTDHTVLSAITDARILVGDWGDQFAVGAVTISLRRDFGIPNVGLIPIGAYEPRWFMKAQHVDPSEAVQIMLDTGCLQALGIHWGTFPMSDESREAPVEALHQVLLQREISTSAFVAAWPGDVLDLVTSP